MKELADSFAERQKAGSSETEKGEKKVEVVCSKHPEEPRLFCKDEERAVCPVCEFSLHQSHKVVPVEQAVSELKDLLKSDLESLQDKRDKYKGVEETYKKVFQVVQLDYDRGEVSFYAPEDMTPICTLRDTFTEKLFPFQYWKAGDAKTADIKICQSEIPL
ncbi:hypothetical protein JOQ06_022036 [Pogonophryne albipinna]|uniref:B box-type domain-containing protein n=1 Tax=Pogonophryne albipinna TaxID=1090488 RepID=A0AAD6ABM8_9TELE|nr:hypothetical protein JOQ06_022036 [Pogonophryne albipinna]